jgi:streptogramin lyase
MRVFSGILVFSTLLATALAAPPSAKRKRGNKRATLLPNAGVKTPGVQIPMASLQPEILFTTPANPGWLSIADSLWLPDTPKTSLDRIDPKSRDDHFQTPVTGLSKPCGGVTSGFGGLWTLDCASRSLIQFDPKSEKTVHTMAFGAADVHSAVAVTADSVWVLADTRTTLVRIDPQQKAVVAETRLPAGCQGLLSAEGSLWIACPSENKVLRVNAMTNLVDQYIPVSAGPDDLAFGENSIWVLCGKDGKVDQIDGKTNKVTKSIDLGVPGVSGQIALGEGSIWVTLPGFPLTRIDLGTQTVAQQFYGDGGGAIQVGGGFVWLANTHQGTLWKIDPKRVLATLAE